MAKVYVIGYNRKEGRVIQMNKGIPIGVQDFRKLREEGYYTVDKTMMIADFLQRKSEVTLITRPRRFGKTLNMSMLAEFFDITKDSKVLFKGLAIMDTHYAKEMNQYPVIFISFANCKGNFEYTRKFLFESLKKEYKRYNSYFTSSQYDEESRRQVQEVYDAIQNEQNLVDIASAISVLCEFLYTVFKKKAMVLIDEYDTPFIEAHVHGYYDKVHDALASLLRTSLKGNDFLQYGMLTGIQRVAKENVFSDLNNLVVCTVKDKQYNSYFGFTKEETKSILEAYGLTYSNKVKEMYDGYKFFNISMYNPWSIINYVDTQELIPYWVNTSSNTMIKNAMENCESSFNKAFELLIEHGYVETQVLMDTSFYEQSQASSLWGLFVNAGYLTIDETISISDNWYKIRIPNKEVRSEFRNITAHYLKIEDMRMTTMMMALKQNDMPTFFQNYQDTLMHLPSYHDLKDENSYHVMMLGMCAWLSVEYTILSNKESGIGRADIILKKKKEYLPNIVIEFKYTKKAAKTDDLKLLAVEGLTQIKEKNYTAGLQGSTVCISLAHHGKQVFMEYEELDME